MDPSAAGQPLDPHTRHVLHDLAEQWTRDVARAVFLPGTRAEAREVLRGLLYRLVLAGRAEPFDDTEAHRIGVELVQHRLFTPDVLGGTINLLGQHLPALLGGNQVSGRVVRILSQLAAGFSTAQRNVAASSAESINKSQKNDWLREHARLRARLTSALLRDPVTELPNLAHLRGHLLDLITAPDVSRVGVCLLSIEGFGQLNNALGHDLGERLLDAIASRLESVAAQGGWFLAHLDGPRFALVMAGTRGPDDIVKACYRAQRALVPSIPVDGHLLHVTTRAGIVEGPTAGTATLTWLRDVDIALGWAHTDRATCAMFDPARAAADLHRHRLAADLPAAIERGEFTVYYQPLVRLVDGVIVGCEALARWRRPDGTIIGPQQFIGLAEQTGLISALGSRILCEACAQAARWHEQGHRLLVSVNVSPLQLDDPSLLGAVTNALQRSKLPPSSLQLEITESAALDAAHPVLQQLAELGVRLAVDDFGTGYSNLTALPNLPVRTVKLAAGFLDDIDTDPTKVTMLRDTIEMLHHLHITVTAEGVETRRQQTLLRHLTCDLGQGYHLARPDTASAVTALLQGEDQ